MGFDIFCLIKNKEVDMIASNLLKIAAFSLVLANTSLAQESGFYSATSGPASIGVNVNPRGNQLILDYQGPLNQCDASGYLEPVNAYFIFHSAQGTDILIRKMSGECRTNSHPEATGFARFQSFGSNDVLWVLMGKVLDKSQAVRFELAFARDDIWDSADGKNFPVGF